MAGDAGGPVSAVAEQTEAYRADFERLGPSRASEPGWLGERREAALARFLELGFPGPKEERWRFTSVAPIARRTFTLADGAAAVEAAELPAATFGAELDASRWVFVDGRLRPEFSDRGAGELEVMTFAAALDRRGDLLQEHLGRVVGDEGNTFSALNGALFSEGVLVHVPAGTVVHRPVQLVFFSTGGAARDASVSYPRTLIVCGRGSQARIIQAYAGREGAVYFTDAVTEVALGEGAVLDLQRLQRESLEAFHVSTTAVRQGRDSRFSEQAISAGAALARADVNQRFEGPGGECALNGLFVASDNQHTDTHTRIDHAAPHCASRELYKGIVDGRARGVFHGTIVVEPGAVKTDALQVNKNLLLSREALVNSTPALEIFTDDVKCKHGSTTGQLDEAALFYLRSRGIDAESARGLLVYAFAAEVLSKFEPEPLRRALVAQLARRLPVAAEVA
jgi:Fe-S cluster assembly protein SufD